nr:ankyrin repeat-containing protein P16F5.05C isoform X4 [Ipomoea batatas]
MMLSTLPALVRTLMVMTPDADKLKMMEPDAKSDANEEKHIRIADSPLRSNAGTSGRRADRDDFILSLATGVNLRRAAQQLHCQLGSGMGVEHVLDTAERSSHETMLETIEALLEVPN